MGWHIWEYGWIFRSCKANWLACLNQDKLEASEQLGDLLQKAGDADAALACYRKANARSKVIQGLALKGDFATLSQYASPKVWNGQ